MTSGQPGNGIPLRGSTWQLAVRRIAAWSIDWLIIVGYAAATVPLGLLLSGWSVQMPPAAWNIVSFALLIAPAALWLAIWEARPRGASPGKLLLQLRVRTSDGLAPRTGRSLLRNGLKVALPWELGHTAAFTLATSTATAPATIAALVCGVAACLIGGTYVASLFVGSGRTPYDRVTGTSVCSYQASPEGAGG